MDDWEHLGGVDDAVDLEVGSVVVLALLDGLLVVAAVDEPLRVGLGEPVELVLDVPAEGVDLVLGEPLGVQVAPAAVFDEVFLFLAIISFSSP